MYTTPVCGPSRVERSTLVSSFREGGDELEEVTMVLLRRLIPVWWVFVLQGLHSQGISSRVVGDTPERAEDTFGSGSTEDEYPGGRLCYNGVDGTVHTDRTPESRG